ncbi:MAG TPA: hypothetical protein VE268_01405, partial [Herpetosiphonaceae bacterium]|nr:hypothetical protein [Herpetosiphonaceae bacterium]
QANGKFINGKSYKNDVSPPLRNMKPLKPVPHDREEERENPPLPVHGHTDQDDPVVQRSFRPSIGPSTPSPSAPLSGAGWEGINQAGGCGNCAPPDTNGDVGPNHYVQTVNSSFAVYSKAGTRLYPTTAPSAAINTLWQGFGGACQANNDGDPVVLYDSIADRWLISQFTASSPYDECVAISQTADPTGAWYRYAFQLSTTDFPDYPHLGVWPDGYYMTVNWFTNGQTYAGPRPYVFDRNAMLTGAAATYQTTSTALGSSYNPMLPSDLDGATLPPSGQPNVFVEFGGTLDLYKFHVDWTAPANTAFAQSASLTAAGFTQLCPTTRSCIAQPSTSTKLDGLGDRLMNRLAYRNMGTYQALVATHSVNAGGTKRSVQAGVRWYEIRNPAGTATIYQQGTYAPDGNARWLGSVAMDKNGDIGLGYSVSSSSVYPSIRYTGRLAGDPLNTMTQGETPMFAGSGYQSGVNRWGDYAAMSVDPSDDCTFWFTTEYNNSGGWGWGTRIGSFKLPGCP